MVPRNRHATVSVVLMVLATALSAAIAAEARDDRSAIRALAAGGVDGILALCGQLIVPEGRAEGDDTRARTLVHGLALHASLSERTAERQVVQGALLSALNREQRKPIQAFLIRQLRFVADDTAVDVLGGLLPDEELNEPATQALLTIGTERAAAAFHKARPATDNASTLAVVTALGQLRARDAVADLLPLASHADRGLRLAAMRSLASIGDAAAVDVIRQATGAESAYERARAGDAYAVLLRRLAEEGGGERAEKLCGEWMARRGDDAHVQSACIDVLALIGTGTALETLLPLLRSKVRRVRLAAERAVVRLPGTKVTQRLMAELGRQSGAEKVAILRLLGGRGDRAALGALTEATRDGNEDVRRAAIGALADVGGREAVPTLLTLLESNDALSVAEAKEALVRIQWDSLSDSLAERVPKSPAGVAGALLDVLVRRGAAAHMSLFTALSLSPEENVRIAAVRGLGSLGGPRELRTLLELANTAPSSKPVREAIEKAMASVCRRAVDRDDIVPLLAAAASKAPRDAHCAVLRTLGIVGGPEAQRPAEAGLTNTDESVRDTAVRVLSEWPDPGPVDVLLGIVRTSQDEVHRVLALRGYVRLAGLEPGRTNSDRLAMFRTAMEVSWRDEERKLVLAGLGKMKDGQALEVVRPCLDSESLRQEAVVAVVSIIDAVRATGNAALLRRVLTMTGDDKVRQRGEKILGELEKYVGCVVNWRLAGPYEQPGTGGDQLLDVVFDPEKPDSKDVTWREVSGEADGRVDIRKFLAGGSRVAYLRCTVLASEATAARLEAGSDDALKIWLNGEVVHANGTMRPFTWCEDNVEVELVKGENTLLVKITQGGGDWMGNVRVRSRDGGSLTGVTFGR